MLMTKKISTKGVTFRIPESLISELQHYAETNHISLNTLVNQILNGFVDWDVRAVEAGWMVFPKLALRQLIDSVSKEKLEVIAKNKAEYHKDINLLMRGKNDLEGFISVLKNRCKRSGFPFSETKKDNSIQFIVQHDMGEKWSHFSKILYSEFINSIGLRVEIETTQNTTILNIYK